MHVVYGLDNLVIPDRQTAVAIGNFDGVHIGHQAILRRTVEQAQRHLLLSAVKTFDIHPLKILHPESAPPLLMPLEERIEIMKNIGIELVVVAKCLRSLLEMDRDTFIQKVLVKQFNLRYIVEGPNFRFGCDRSGDIDHLIKVGPPLGFEGIKIGPIHIDLGEHGVKTVSSSLVRKLVAAGQMDLAAAALGRPYILVGNVVSGCQRGRTIGFPTANLDVAGQLLPKNGIYAAYAELDNLRRPAAVVIGPAPTFNQPTTAVEAFILDYNANLYGKIIRLRFARRIRDILKFPDPSDLVQQIKKDVADVREILQREENQKQ